MPGIPLRFQWATTMGAKPLFRCPSPIPNWLRNCVPITSSLVSERAVLFRTSLTTDTSTRKSCSRPMHQVLSTSSTWRSLKREKNRRRVASYWVILSLRIDRGWQKSSLWQWAGPQIWVAYSNNNSPLWTIQLIAKITLSISWFNLRGASPIRHPLLVHRLLIGIAFPIFIWATILKMLSPHL